MVRYLLALDFFHLWRDAECGCAEIMKERASSKSPHSYECKIPLPGSICDDDVSIQEKNERRYKVYLLLQHLKRSEIDIDVKKSFDGSSAILKPLSRELFLNKTIVIEEDDSLRLCARFVDFNRIDIFFEFNEKIDPNLKREMLHVLNPDKTPIASYSSNDVEFFDEDWKIYNIKRRLSFQAEKKKIKVLEKFSGFIYDENMKRKTLRDHDRHHNNSKLK